MSIFKKYLSETSGNFAIMFGLGSAVLAMGMAVAIDVAGMTNAKQSWQNDVDSAALAAVIEVAANTDDSNANNNSDEHYKEAVIAALSANGAVLDGAKPVVNVTDSYISVDITAPYDLNFGKLLNIKTANLTVSTMVALPSSGNPVEIALVLDNTESMNFFGKMTALKVGARELIDAVEDSNSESKIALVPFARYVDIGVDKRGEPWLDVPVEFDTNRTWQQATHSGGTCHTETRTKFEDGVEVSYETNVCTGQTTTYEEMSKVVESRWIGCVGVRSDGLHLTDDNYATTAEKIPGLLHVNPHEVTGFSVDEESWCPHYITPLTDDFDLLDNQIGKLYGTDRTYIPIGLNWGRRILSPQAPFTEADTVNPKRQIMVLMSDGDNTAYLDDEDDHESLPYVEDLRKIEQEEGVIPPDTNEDTAALCEAIKTEGVEVYTIAFQVKNTMTKNLLLNCASSSKYYYDAGSNEALIQAFRDISEGLGGEIRLMR